MALTSTTKRWGLLGQEDSTKDDAPWENVSWTDFDHKATLYYSLSRSTRVLFLKTTFKMPTYEPRHAVVRYCHEGSFNVVRKKLTEMAISSRNKPFLVTVKGIFTHNNNVYVASEHLDAVSLAEVIDCSLALQEVHIAEVLKQVIRSLIQIEKYASVEGIRVIYGSVQASNILITTSGEVKLLAFGSRVMPQFVTNGNQHDDRRALASLVRHMITRDAETCTPISSHSNLASWLPSGKSFDVKFAPSHQLFDFGEMCFSDSVSLEKIQKNPFLQQGSPLELSRFVLNTSREMAREVFTEQLDYMTEPR